jgi:drug/metabolite transporter (DMT)-like permease
VTFTAAGILITVATAIVCILIGQFGYVYAIGHLSPTVVSAFENVLPVTAVVLSIFIFGKMLSGMQLLGAILILLAVTVLAVKDNN